MRGRPSARSRTGSGRAWLSGGASTDEPSRHQAGTHHWTTNNWSLMGRKPVKGCRQDWHTSDPTSRATRAPHTLEVYRTKPAPHSTCRVGFPRQDEEGTVTVDGHSDADAAGCPKTRRSASGGGLRIGRHTLATVVRRWCR